MARRDDDEKKPKKLNKQSVSRLFALARTEWKMIALATFFLAVSSAASLAFPRQMGTLIDQLKPGNEHLVNEAALALLAIFAVQGVFTALRYVTFNNVGERIVARVRADLYRAILGQEIGFFDERRTGELTNRLGSDTTVLQSAVSANISMALRNVAQAIGGVVLLFVTAPKLTLLMLLVVPPVAIGAVIYGRRVRKLSRDVQDALASANEIAEESIAGVRTVRSFAAEQAETTRYAAAVDRSYALARKRTVTAGVFMGVASFLGLGGAVLVFWRGGAMVISGEMTTGALTSFLIYTLFIAFSLAALSEIWADLLRASGASERVFDLLDKKPAIPNVGGDTLEQVRGEVKYAGVRFAYPTRKDAPVLAGIDLHLRAGEIVALVGPSGSGKSTIASLLSRFYDPDGGAILLDGRDLRGLDPTWLRRQVGMVAQEPILFSTTVAENIRYARPDATLEEVEAAARAANAHEFVERFPERYQTLVGERGVQLSGGQKQRVAIARAVLKDPRILVLDEATSALDAESEHLVKEALDRLMRGRTTLIIAHRLSTVIDADRVLVLDGGKVVQSGDHRALMSEDGLYKRLIERQFVAA